MLTATARFKAALKESHTAMSRIVLLQPGTTSGYTEAGKFSIASGTLMMDGTRNVWRQANVTVIPHDMFSKAELDKVGVTSRIRIDRGIRFAEGPEEWVTMATLQVQEVVMSVDKIGVDISAYDCGSQIDDYTLITPYVPQDKVGVKLTTVAAIQDLVNTADVWETSTWKIDTGIDQTVTPPDGTVFTGGRWEAVNNLAKSLGAIVHSDVDGSWRIRHADITNDAVVDTYKTGGGGVIVGHNARHSRDEMYNAVPLRWEGVNEGGLVFLVDNDASSPTFWNGPFGRKPAPEENVDTVKTAQQAQDAAAALLSQKKGATRLVDFTAVHNPLLEPLDVIDVKVDGKTQRHVIDSISYPLAGGTMSCQTRMLREGA